MIIPILDIYVPTAIIPEVWQEKVKIFQALNLHNK